MSTDSNDPSADDPSSLGHFQDGTKLIELPIEDELKDSYLTYAMSVIVARALPDVRDGLKPSQRRVLVAMNDLNLSPGAARTKCAKICGDTSGNYHPHGEMIIYPTLVRMAQDWNMRYMLVDKQGNFGSIAGLPPAAMRYTEARMSPFAALMMEDLERGTVDFIPTYNEERQEPTVLPSKFPNLLVNGANGIAVGMATSIPPHNLTEVCDALLKVIDSPEVSIDELMEIIPGPDFPTGGIVCGQAGVRRGYYTGRSTITMRARCEIETPASGKSRIVIKEIPYQQARDTIEEKIAELVNEDRIKGISAIRNESDLKEPVRIILELKRDAEPEIVLNQLYEFSPLQSSYSLILLALVDGKPRVLTLKQMLEEYLRHRVTVIRRRTLFLIKKARARRHIVEGLLMALADIDQVIQVIRTSRTRVEAKDRLSKIECPSSMIERALGESGFSAFTKDWGVQESYRLSPVQADAILRMTLGQLVNLEQGRLADEYRGLLAELDELMLLAADERRMLALVREDLLEIKRRFGDKRRTEISGEELGDFDMEDLITEENMVVTISQSGYIKRTPVSVYRSQKRGGKGLTGAKADDDDPIKHFFVASTHDYLLFFTNRGKVFWQKVYGLPQLGRDSKGRALVNLLQFSDGEAVADCLAVSDFSAENTYLAMATRAGLIKKTPLSQYGRPQKGGIIAIKLKEEDELVDVVVVQKGDDVLMATEQGMAIRFHEWQARSMGRNSSGVKGIRLTRGDRLVGMVVVDPQASLLTVCVKGYGKRTNFGPAEPSEGEPLEDDSLITAETAEGPETAVAAEPPESDLPDEEAEAEGEESGDASSARYRIQGRGGKGIKNIKTSARNGPVVAVASVSDSDEVLMITSRGKLQRISAADIKTIGRNTQGVRLMNLDEDDRLTAVVAVPAEPAANLPESPPQRAGATPGESAVENADFGASDASSPSGEDDIE